MFEDDILYLKFNIGVKIAWHTRRKSYYHLCNQIDDMPEFESYI